MNEHLSHTLCGIAGYTVFLSVAYDVIRNMALQMTDDETEKLISLMRKYILCSGRRTMASSACTDDK